MKIVILDGYALNPGDNSWSLLEACGELTVYDRSTEEETEQRAQNADILITNKAPVRGALIERLPSLKFISVLATGYDIVDVAAARKRQIPISNVPAYGTDTVAQYVLAMMLELCLHIGEHARSVSEGKWSSSPDWTYWNKQLIELRDQTLGIVGFGRIGRRVAELASAFGMQVLYATRTPRTGSAYEHRSLEELFAQSDFISLHCSLSADTRGMVDRVLLQRMKRSAFLINTARGALINEGDLAAALVSGDLAGAALDVLSSEPPRPENPLLHAPNCIITPHIAWASLAARQRIMQTTANNVKAFLAGSPTNVVS
jgi:glycerate dehydrogenase